MFIFIFFCDVKTSQLNHLKCFLQNLCFERWWKFEEYSLFSVENKQCWQALAIRQGIRLDVSHWKYTATAWQSPTLVCPLSCLCSCQTEFITPLWTIEVHETQVELLWLRYLLMVSRGSCWRRLRSGHPHGGGKTHRYPEHLIVGLTQASKAQNLENWAVFAHGTPGDEA